MDDHHRVGFVTMRLERLSAGTRVRLITCHDTASSAPTTTEMYDDPDIALAAVHEFVYRWLMADT